MSGGYFEYQQHNIENIIDNIETLIRNDFSEGEYQYEFSEKTKKEFEKGLKVLKMAAIYTKRIDWLLSGDDSEDNFHEILKQKLEKLNED